MLPGFIWPILGFAVLVLHLFAFSQVLCNLTVLSGVFLLRTNQEDGQLEFVVEHHRMNAAGAAEPGCDLIQEVGMEDEEEDAWAWKTREEKGVWEVSNNEG